MCVYTHMVFLHAHVCKRARLMRTCVCVYTYAHMCMHACVRVYMYAHTCIHACVCGYVHARLHAFTQTCIQACMHTCIMCQTYTHSFIHETSIHAYMHHVTNIHTFLHTYSSAHGRQSPARLLACQGHRSSSCA